MKKTIFTYIFIFLFCLVFLLGTVSDFLYRNAFDAEKYLSEMEKNDYEQIVLEAVKKQLDNMGDIITIDSDEIYKALNEKEVVEHSKKYTKNYLEAFLSGKEFSSEDYHYSIKYIENSLRKSVEAFYETEETSFSEEEFQIIFDYVEKQINAALRFLSKSILDKTLPLGKYALIAKNVFKILRIAYIPSGLLLLGIILMNLKKGIGKTLYKAGTALFLPSSILFFPTCLFDNYNLGDKIVLGRSPLSVVFSSVLNTLVKGFEKYVGIFFVFASVLIVIGASIIVFGKKKMPDAVIEKAYGKINLCLDIVGRRSNGYHNVESIMHTVNLWDTVEVKRAEKISITCSNPNVPTDETNLAYKAAKSFFEKADIKGGAAIHIEKRIPMAAGMAGGSSDGAATLRALNRIYGNPLSSSQLEEIGGKLGADVPFCIRGGTEGVTGIGFDFIGVSKPPKFIYVIACGKEGISTPEMYREYDLKYSPPLCDAVENAFTGKSERLRVALENGNKEEIFSSMFNCFEEIAEMKVPKIREIKNAMLESNAKIAMMSGSGPSVFGIFEKEEDAEKAKALIISMGADAFVVFDE